MNNHKSLTALGLMLIVFTPFWFVVPKSKPAVHPANMQAANPEATVFGGLLNSVAQSFLPHTFALAPTSNTTLSQLTLVDIRFCGAETAERAKMVAIGYPGGAPAQRPTPVLLSDDDCRATLAGNA